MNCNCFILIISFYIIALPLRAQDKDDTILLKNILNDISKKHQVNFNYIEEEIAVFKMIPIFFNYISSKSKINQQHCGHTKKHAIK